MNAMPAPALSSHPSLARYQVDTAFDEMFAANGRPGLNMRSCCAHFSPCLRLNSLPASARPICHF